MQVTKGTWRMREQCVPGSLSSSLAQEPGNEANHPTADGRIVPSIHGGGRVPLAQRAKLMPRSKPGNSACHREGEGGKEAESPQVRTKQISARGRAGSSTMHVQPSV